MNKDVPYWNPRLETLPQQDLEKLQLTKFRRILQWAYDRSRFHRALYKDAGLTPEDVRTMADVRRVPKVEKSMLRNIQRKDPFPYGDALCVPLDEVTEFRQTSGTTGQPVYQPPGRTGSGGPNAGPPCSGLRAIALMIGFSFRSDTTSLWPSGPATMPAKRSAAKQCPAVSWTRSPGY